VRINYFILISTKLTLYHYIFILEHPPIPNTIIIIPYLFHIYFINPQGIMVTIMHLYTINLLVLRLSTNQRMDHSWGADKPCTVVNTHDVALLMATFSSTLVY